MKINFEKEAKSIMEKYCTKYEKESYFMMFSISYTLGAIEWELEGEELQIDEEKVYEIAKEVCSDLFDGDTLDQTFGMTLEYIREKIRGIEPTKKYYIEYQGFYCEKCVCESMSELGLSKDEVLEVDENLDKCPNCNN